MEKPTAGEADRDSGWGWEGGSFVRVIRGELSEKATFEQRPEGKRGQIYRKKLGRERR